MDACSKSIVEATLAGVRVESLEKAIAELRQNEKRLLHKLGEARARIVQADEFDLAQALSAADFWRRRWEEAHARVYRSGEPEAAGPLALEVRPAAGGDVQAVVPANLGSAPAPEMRVLEVLLTNGAPSAPMQNPGPRQDTADKPETAIQPPRPPKRPGPPQPGPQKRQRTALEGAAPSPPAYSLKDPLVPDPFLVRQKQRLHPMLRHSELPNTRASLHPGSALPPPLRSQFPNMYPKG